MTGSRVTPSVAMAVVLRGASWCFVVLGEDVDGGVDADFAETCQGNEGVTMHLGDAAYSVGFIG